jgi:hypothetical protein
MEDAKHGAGMRRYHFAGCSAITALANFEVYYISRADVPVRSHRGNDQ